MGSVLVFYSARNLSRVMPIMSFLIAKFWKTHNHKFDRIQNFGNVYKRTRGGSVAKFHRCPATVKTITMVEARTPT